MTTLLIGVDGQEGSADALAFGAQLVSALDADVLVASAYQGYFERDTALRRAHAAAEQLPTALRREPAGHAPAVASSPARARAVANPSPARALRELAAEEDASLVIVGSTHTGRLGRVLPGSTGERLLSDARYAVAVVPRGYFPTPVERIAVAYDGSPEADAAVALAAELALAFDAGLEVIGIVPHAAYETPGFVDGHTLVELIEDAERLVDAQLEACVSRLPYGVRARPIRLAGDPAQVLTARSERLDLLLTGSRGFGPLRAIVTGAVSGRMQRTAACPVIAVPRAAAA